MGCIPYRFTRNEEHESECNSNGRHESHSEITFQPHIPVVLYIKYMVSHRCKLMVGEALSKLGVHDVSVDLGMVVIHEGLTDGQRLQLKQRLSSIGLQLLDDKRSILIEKIKNAVINMVHHIDEWPKENYSEHLSRLLGYDYTYLANVFSEVQGMTIQQFIILHKIEKVKELLLYDELSLKQISYKLDYSSVSHLSNQFKKITGLTPTFYRKLKQKKERIALENV